MGGGGNGGGRRRGRGEGAGLGCGEAVAGGCDGRSATHCEGCRRGGRTESVITNGLSPMSSDRKVFKAVRESNLLPYTVARDIMMVTNVE